MSEEYVRELAHVEKVVDIQPIAGADRVELATVLGWHCMVAKNQFKVGDLAIYIEIDSKCPPTEAFKFLESKHYAVKTQKYFKGTVISQGLLMHPSDLGLKAEDLHEGQGLTKQLGITYYVQEDNKRKAPSSDQYKVMAQRNQKLFSKRPIRWLMRREWGKKLLFLIFGRKGDKKRRWPEWVVKTDECRIQNCPWMLEDKEPFVITEKVDGCLDRDVSVVTDEGIFNISQIVNKRMDVNVLTYNEALQKCEYKPIKEYHKWERVSDMYDVVVSQQGYRCGNRDKHIRCTSEHSFYIGDGMYVKAKDLKITDTIYHRSIILNSLTKEILIGMLIGDGSLSSKNGKYNGAVDFCHSVKQKKYFDEIVRLLGVGNVSTTEHVSGYGSEILVGHYKSNPDFKKWILENCLKDEKKYITKEWANALTPVSLGFWYMDDGNIRNADDDNVRPTITISTNAYSREECEILVETLLKKYNIVAEIRSGQSYKGNVLYLNTENTNKFCSLIAPYICDDMKYKLPIQFRSIRYCLCDYEATNGNGIVKTNIISINKIDNYNRRHVYDLTVEGNHNYFANGILTHNTSTTWSMKRGKRGKNDFYVCSRNVVMRTEDQTSYYETPVYQEIANKYNAKQVLTYLLDQFPKAEWVTIQGEIYGAGIQKRDYSIKDHDFAAFNLITSDHGRFGTLEMERILKEYGIPCVPIVNASFVLPDTVDEMIEYATGTSMIDGLPREGVVCRSMDGSKSFKAVSNEYLLKYHG